MKKITISDGAWYLFLLCVFTPSLVMSFATGELSVSDTYSYVFGTITGFAGEWIAYILYLPLGFITSILPNDSYHVLTADSTPSGHSAHQHPDTHSTLIRTGSRSAATQVCIVSLKSLSP
ncbi:hypothetical protein, partial [Pseudomonas sp. ANT_J12]|uniref:hypothetical protein n=1 Tax=Pseudomonas sp. ANT_J12 TaxID=2597351 RepID=UPI001C49C516